MVQTILAGNQKHQDMPTAPNHHTPKPPKSWLKYVLKQSWEPELLISGMAIFATLNLSDLFFTDHAITGHKGFVAMLDVGMLPDGLHRVQVNRIAVNAADSSRLEEGRLLSYEPIIPFWLTR